MLGTWTKICSDGRCSLLAEGRHDDHDEGAGTYIVSLSLNSGGDAAVVTENLKS